MKTVVEKKQIVMSVAVVVLAAVFVICQYVPLNRKAARLKEANAALIAENSAAATRLSQLPVLQKGIQQGDEKVGDFDAKIPLKREHGLFLQMLAEVMKEQGLGELTIQPAQESKIDSIYAIPVYIRCQGKLIQIFNFFRALEQMSRVVQIQEVVLNGSQDYDGVVVMQAKTAIFYRDK